MDEQRVLKVRPSVRPHVRTLAPLAVVLAVGAAIAQAPDKRLSDQIRQVRQDVLRNVPEDQQPTVETGLARAAAAVEAGRTFLALYELEGAFEMTRAFTFARQSGGITSPDDFRARWKSIGEPAPAAGSRRSVPAVVEALAASAESRGVATYRASLPYGEDANISAGLYYLGESQAVGAFAAFARSLEWPRAGTPPALRSIAAELDAFESDVTSAYERMTKAQHPTYVLTSVTLKRARALDQSGHFAGALLEYLLARNRFAALHSDSPAEPADARRIAEARARFAAGVDHSIGRLFVEMAEAALAHENIGVRRTAAPILDDVLPAYHAAIGTAGAQRAGLRDNAGARSAGLRDVTITLVRWPYT